MMQRSYERTTSAFDGLTSSKDVYRRLSGLEQSQNALMQQMEGLAERSNQLFPGTGIPRLRVHKTRTTFFALRWRASIPGEGQKFLKLFGTEYQQYILERVSPEQVMDYAAMERKRLEFNARMAACMTEIGICRRLRDDLWSLDDFLGEKPQQLMH